MAAKPSYEVFIALLVNAVIIVIAASFATTLTAFLLSKFNDTKFKKKNLKEGNKLLYYFILYLHLNCLTINIISYYTSVKSLLKLNVNSIYNLIKLKLYSL